MQPKEIRIDGAIGQGEGELSAAWLRSELPANGTDPVRVSLHSEGGSVFEGFAMHDVLAKYTGPKVIAVESTAFSIASFIAMAGDEIEMSPNAYFMLHNPRVEIEGDDEELGKQAGMIADLKTNMINAYAQRTGKTTGEIQGVLKAETYFNATDAVAFGLADRVTLSPVKGRAFARLDSMPHGVVTALFGAGSGGDNDSKKGHKMPESTPVAATLKEIKAAFPKAKAERVVAWALKEMPMASVAAAAAEEMMTENETLAAKVSAMETELQTARSQLQELASRAKAMEGEEMPPEEEEGAKAKAAEDEKAKAKAKASGVKPVAKATSGRPSASAQWHKAIEEALPQCRGDKMKAAALANRNNPGLRESYLAEFSAR